MTILKVVRIHVDLDDPNFEFVDVEDVIEANLVKFDSSELHNLIDDIQAELKRRSNRTADATTTRKHLLAALS